MKTAPLNEMKKELSHLEAPQVLELCLRLVKYKKENKELLSYLLFEAGDENAYIESVKNEIDTLYGELYVSGRNTYLFSKGLRKILRLTTKYIRYSGKESTEVELLVHFCSKLRKTPIKMHSSAALVNLYNNQLKKINKTLQKLHEDLQFDYEQEIKKLPHYSV